ncbi:MULTISPECIES: TetR/AcrR family transcriptional regulator [Brevibacterium]|uniref:TetR/AcrR family transcriptional regulator n=2 Tax=Brevibacterium casei TaxID=33889 RepID=A0A449D414_9MICO|nr:TetR/AcrR family transcriptional regulator [Brevibacterium casei]NJE68386.1 TetR/AcrR family transcriptional regulator [Brevibacterium sp. LS14]MBE4693853.1 TetR/AcrR family transcriptional regulator [Brevibacterium casei]MBY3576976.1 TetR/AcrR family transcriptional regulator [Brevibacterium casei]MCT1447090.1 TetR/AcrR family transcriptional regulator [Brevibacterium casei]MCT1550596.1 TetR/AcrR family transcriptional regulator [Brevibacterium casei]
MKSLTDGRSTRWQEHRDSRRRELLRTVRHVVDERGDDLSMEQISEFSGTTKAVLYRYFTDRAGLQEAMGDWAMQVIANSLDEASTTVADSDDARPVDRRDTLEAMIRAFVGLAAGAPNVYRFCDQAVGRFDPGEQGGFFSEVADLLAERLDLDVTDSRFDGDDGRLWAAGAIGFVRAATETWLKSPGSPDAFAASVSTWLWASLPPEAGAALPAP